jgi:DNA (cytosine-5)-methyltransferase 1
MTRKKRRVLSLFTGAGGLDLGLEAAGFDTVMCVENDAAARATLAHNRPHWKLATPGDIHAHRPEDLLKEMDASPGDIDLIAGGPPCQPFSKSGYWFNGDSKRLADPRASTLEAYLHFVDVVQPRVLLVENVRGLTYDGKDDGLQMFQKEIARINKARSTRYQVNVLNLNAANYGVPQLRERVFLIASRNGELFAPPEETHGADKERYLTAWDAIGDLDSPNYSSELSLTGKWAGLLPSIPEGCNYLWHTKNGKGEPLFGWRSRFWSFLLKLSKTRPSWTIQASPGPATGPFHWKNRMLSVREMCRIQTIPDSYNISGNRRAAQRQIGNAVPSALAEILGLEIRRQLLGERVQRRKITLLPRRATSVPRSAPTQPVPKEYDVQRGNHLPHRGTGKGPAAKKRPHSKEATLERHENDHKEFGLTQRGER